jgi:exodeoxyribonuclease V alpha subunit
MANLETIDGRIRKVIFQSGDFYILSFFSEDMGELVAKGNIFGLVRVVSDITIRLIGKWVRHPKYGRQLLIRNWEPWARYPQEVRYFLWNCVDGFSDSEVLRNISKKGPEAFQTLTETPNALLDAQPPIGEPRAVQAAILGWGGALSTRNLSTLLQAGGVRGDEIQLAMARFGQNTASVIKENPYRLLEVMDDFSRVDKLAMKLGFSMGSPERLQGGILLALRERSKQGHLFLRRGELKEIVPAVFSGYNLIPPRGDYREAIKKLVESKGVVLEPGVGIYLDSLHFYERESAARIRDVLKEEKGDLRINIQSFIADYERSNRMSLSDAQKEAVEKLDRNRILVLTGLPGTGKTTCVRSIVRLFETTGLTFTLMAPTGIAAKRLSSVTGQPASTIHRALRYDGSSWGHNSDNRYVVDAVIVDEMSMVDQELFYRLLSALRPDTYLVLVGDDAQLPSVGPGNVLRELVACEDVPNVRLTQIFRQSEKGEIVKNSHLINKGEMPVLQGPKDKTEFHFVPMDDEDRILSFVVAMASKLKSRNDNFQVLSPKYEGRVGVNTLNERLRDKLNPRGPREWKQGEQHFRTGDRVMVIQNDYDLGVYNGDMGKLVSISRESLSVRIHGLGENDLDTEITFTYRAAEQKLRLAYAISVHKSQGSEFNHIVLPITRSQGRMLQRNLLYTAVTRARKSVWLIGSSSAVQIAIDNNKVVRRNTVLRDLISV